MADKLPIYLDYNATTPVLPEVVDAMLPYLREHFGNPSSSHIYGKRAREAVEEARRNISSLLNCDPAEIIFTSGGTESNNLAIRGVAQALPSKKHIVTSTVEHPATKNPCNFLEKQGYEVTRIPVDQFGRVSADEIAPFLRGDTAVLTVMHANNETGSIMPISEIASLARKKGIIFHTDAAQSAGKISVDVNELGIDLLSIAGHKLYAPKGVGALFVRAGTPIAPFALGAGHERGLRPGTENVASIVALGVAAYIAAETQKKESKRIRGLREKFWALLKKGIPELALNGHPEERLPNTLNIRLPGVSGRALLSRVAAEFSASAGSACHEGGSETPSDVLTAMGIPAKSALGALRLSLGKFTKEPDIEIAATAIIREWNKMAR
ncbi:MAG: cysteine desulfurase NifS [Myxococcota bacterium]